MHRLRLVVGGLAALSMTLGVGQSVAFAGDSQGHPPPVTISKEGAPAGADTSQVGDATKAMAREKAQLVAEFKAAQSDSSKLATFRQHLASFMSRTGGPPLRAQTAAASRGMSIHDYCIPSCDVNATDGDVYTVFQGQAPNGSYCGPSTAYMILNALGNTTSVDGEGLDQSCLAGNCGSGAPNSTKYLETNYWGGTPWWVSAADQPMPQTLNYWRTGSYSGYYIPVGSPSVGTEKDDMVTDIVSGYPLALNENESAGGNHLPGHPAIDIGHWLDNNGFHNSGWTVHYADPASGLAGWSPAQFEDVDLTYMNQFVQQHGIVW